jgi:serine/threonine protein kinase
MLTSGNRVKILDFGVARRAWTAILTTATKSMETMTASGGTPAYMAPEVLLQQPDDGRSDLFSSASSSTKCSAAISLSAAKASPPP